MSRASACCLVRYEADAMTVLAVNNRLKGGSSERESSETDAYLCLYLKLARVTTMHADLSTNAALAEQLTPWLFEWPVIVCVHVK